MKRIKEVVFVVLVHALVMVHTFAAVERGMPAGARVSILVDRDTYFLGENILLHYCIENLGGKDFKVDVGGDYRGGTRANRFKVTATDANGVSVADPAPVQWNMGGLSPSSVLTNGAKWYEQVWLVRYCLFDKSGVYHVRIFHDLGWGAKQETDTRELTVKITLKKPSAEDARKVVDEMFAASKYGGATWGQKSKAQADFSILRDPVYLPILQEHARKGSCDALLGIGSIVTPEATAAIVDLMKPGADVSLEASPSWNGRKIWLPLGAEAKSLSMAAAVLLQYRLPGGGQGGFFRGDEALTKQLQSTWRPELAPVVHQFAMGLMKEMKRDYVLLAARELKCVGRPEDLPALLKFLDQAVSGTTGEFRGDHGYPEPLKACDELAGVCLQLSTNTPVFQSTPASAGEALLYVCLLKTNAADCVSGWQTNCEVLLQHPLPYIRAQTLSHLPRPLPDSMVQAVRARMIDEDATVQNRAFLIANELKLTGCREQALKVLANAKIQWLFHEASRTALNEGANYECAKIWAQRLDDKLQEPGPAMAHWAMMALWDIISGGGHISGGFNSIPDAAALQTLKEQWLQFLEAHQQEIKAGQRFRPDDGKVPKALLPAGWQFYPAK